jgi:hypothetical protein
MQTKKKDNYVRQGPHRKKVEEDGLCRGQKKSESQQSCERSLNAKINGFSTLVFMKRERR